MDDLISRAAALDAPEKYIKDCNPEHFVGHQKFIEFMDNAEIGSFGNWQFANGFNMGLTAAEVAIRKLPSAQPEQRWIPCSERLPEDDTLMLVNYIDERPNAMDIWIGWHEMENVWYIDGEAHSKEFGNEVVAWMPLPEPAKLGGD